MYAVRFLGAMAADRLALRTACALWWLAEDDACQAPRPRVRPSPPRFVEVD